MLAGSLSVCRGIFILIMNFPGVSTTCTLFYRIFQLVDDTLGLTSSISGDMGLENAPRGNALHQRTLENYMDDSSCKLSCLELST